MPSRKDKVGSRYVFISYQREDRPFVERLRNVLVQHAQNVWLDTSEILAGQDWQKAIIKALRGASAILLLASRYSAKSQWVRYEITSLLSMGKLVIPVLLDDTGKELLTGSLANLQWVDFRQGDFNSGVKMIVSALANVLPPVRRPKPRRRRSKWYFFISYAEEDSDFVTRLRSFLKDRGYAYWDYAESARNYNAQTVFELEDAISNSAACLCVISDAWRNSRWTIREYFFAEEVKRPGFLLKAKPIRPSLAIAGSTFIDFTVDVELGFSRLDAALKRKEL